MNKIKLSNLTLNVQKALYKGKDIKIPLIAEYRGIMGSEITESELYLKPLNSKKFFDVHNVISNLDIDKDVYDCIENIYDRISWEDINRL